MPDKELTLAQIKRHDKVDNAIHTLIEDLAGGDLDGGTELEWDIEHISTVREAVQGVICGKLKIMTKMEFYPYIAE